MKSTRVESRIIILVISFIALAIFYGCGSHSSTPVSVSVPSEIVLSSREVVIDEKGRLPAVTFPNGVKIEASEENTLTPGITVKDISSPLLIISISLLSLNYTI